MVLIRFYKGFKVLEAGIDRLKRRLREGWWSQVIAENQTPLSGSIRSNYSQKGLAENGVCFFENGLTPESEESLELPGENGSL